ncbi:MULTISPECIES: RNA polymerase sigma-70 factor [Aestuariibaculum]|uniref:RNA polymerase sigma-70 factor n=1 Tax=Aestuariibaculum lutulentum TaxID=2920935 RepID=A0ABS9RJI4_9FLAO|nr:MULTISPECIES: RNA polymerase sigma-70 factor [Aestuariibaculum]MCH4552267.1 RNA polymerase sigma-70 factor [Aestuariibaculum lutulentum]MCR8667343.1 RNA polymerase sigma-70 factor [Aestuariibaculum sp. M13]
MHSISLKEFKAYFDDQYMSLCLFAHKYIGDLELSKDIVQDVFVKIWEDKITFKSENSIKTYLYTSVKNKCLDYLKSKTYKSTNKLSDADIQKLETEPFFMREVAVQETSKIIHQAIATLPKKCAEILLLSIQDYSNQDIANELNISVNTVKAQKKIAYKKLKPILKEYFLFISFALE